MRNPQASRAVTVIALLFVVPVLGYVGRPQLSRTTSLPMVERPPRPQELLAYPEDGKLVGVNPSGFCWTPSDNAKAYRLEIWDSRNSSRIISLGPVTSTVYPLARALEPGEYFWQVFYLDAQGIPYGVSKTRSFIVRPGLPELPMADIARLKTQLVGVRPRLFLTERRLEGIREAVRSRRLAEWKIFLEAADAALEEKSYAEPAGYSMHPFSAAEWRRIYTPAKVASAHLARTALAYWITGETKYLEGARRWMMTLAGWDPRGVTSYDVPQPNGSEGEDEAAMPILERVSLGWDWIGDKLTSDERRRVLAVMTERGNQVLRLLKKQDFLSHPFSNHEGRVLAFLGDAGLSFLGDIPEADQWLDYVIRCYLTSYPAWGGDQGGWAQGISYWSEYVGWLTTFAESLRGVTDVDLFRRPFYRNTGYFAMYVHPPYAPRGAFGDASYHGPSAAERILVNYLADTYEDKVLKWYAQTMSVEKEPASQDPWREWSMEDVVSVLRAGSDSSRLQPRPPDDLDGSRLFPSIGWAAMHSALGDAANDVWVLFKASRFGSFSHSHADQNTFLLNAYGRALAIDSGYYPWYGSPHDELWTRQTRAHNGILVNGRGQPPFTWAASGQIENYERHGIVTIVTGQAGNAYNLPQPLEVLQQWRERLKEPIPSMEPKVLTFERTLAFVASKSKPVLVVQDYLRADAPTTFDWLLHALNPMEVDNRLGAITVRDGHARLAIRLVSTEGFQFSQHDGFPVPPEVAENTLYVTSSGEQAAKFPNQWHLGAHTHTPVCEIKFLAVLVPYHESEAPPDIAPLKLGDIIGFRVGPSEVRAWWGQGVRGKISIDGTSDYGRLVVKTIDPAQSPQAQTVVCR